MTTSPHTGLRRRLGLVAAALAVGFLAFALARGWSEVSRYDWNIDPVLAAAGVAVLLIFYVASGLGYVAVMGALGAESLAPRRTLAIWGVSLLGRYVPGNALMVLGRMELGKDRGVSRRVSLAATVYEQALGLGLACVGAAIYLAHHAGAIPSSLRWAVLVIPFGLVALHPRIFGPMSARVLGWARRAPLTQLVPARHVAALAGWYALTATLLATGVWLLVRSAAGAAAGGVVEVGGAFLLAFVISMVAFIFPSGIGVRDGVFAAALAQSIPTGAAVAVSVGMRLVLTLVELVAIGAMVVAARRT